MKFEVVARQPGSSARRGRLHTARGTVDTPAFMPVGTRGAVRGLRPEEVVGSGAQMILANTYHLYLRPGADVVRSLGGLHRFMNWPGPILTDSGGYQVYSLAQMRTLEDDAVVFRSHLDGSLHRFTPEDSLAVQAALGSDIVMVLDECPALPARRGDLEAAVERTRRWAERSREVWKGPGALFGIVQGGAEEDLRERSARGLVALGFDGYAIGGVSVGEARGQARRIAALTAPMLPEDRPRYLMGVGTPADLVEAAGAGIDLFDCVLPTRNARNGMLFTRQGRLNIQRQEFRIDPRPIEEGCDCPVCARYSRAYLRHLYLAGEMLSGILNTLHNLHFYQRLMSDIRAAIDRGTLAALQREFQRLPEGDENRAAGADEESGAGKADDAAEAPDAARSARRRGRMARCGILALGAALSAAASMSAPAAMSPGAASIASASPASDPAATRAAYERGDCAAALPGLEAEASQKTQDALAQYKLSFCLERAGQGERGKEVRQSAEALFEKEAAAGKGWEPFYYLAAIAALDPEHAVAARARAEEGLKKLPPQAGMDGTACFKASRMAGFAQREEESAEWMRRSAERFAKEKSPPAVYAAAALQRGGEEALEKGENRQAAEWLARAAAMTEGARTAWYLAGVARLRLTEREAALEAFRKLDQEPHRTEVQYAVRLLERVPDLKTLPATLPDGRKVSAVKAEEMMAALRSGCGGEWKDASKPAALALLVEHLKRGQLLRETALGAGCIDLLFR